VVRTSDALQQLDKYDDHCPPPPPPRAVTPRLANAAKDLAPDGRGESRRRSPGFATFRHSRAKLAEAGRTRVEASASIAAKVDLSEAEERAMCDSYGMGCKRRDRFARALRRYPLSVESQTGARRRVEHGEEAEPVGIGLNLAGHSAAEGEQT